jgi:hypothetical protein
MRAAIPPLPNTSPLLGSRYFMRTTKSLYDLNLATPDAQTSGWVSSDTQKRAGLMTAISMRSAECITVSSSHRADLFHINVVPHSISTCVPRHVKP